MFSKVLVANRGAVAARILRTLSKMSVASACVYSEADKSLPYLGVAGETYDLGSGPPTANYLNGDAILRAACDLRADAIHPGYGFLSENADFARKVAAAGIAFVGPAPQHIEAMGHKTKARDLVASLGMPVGAASNLLPDGARACAQIAAEIGYPVLVKPAAGGGGIGMIAARDETELASAIERARSTSLRSFKTSDIYFERLVERPRHIELQIVADRYGNVRHLFERDCSVQRRHQKVIEEARAPGVSASEMELLGARVVEVMRRIEYDNIGTVEMLMGPDHDFNFLEMNTRLQVEHGVTEEITGVDLVELQLRVAGGERLEEVLPDDLDTKGHAIEARVYAEDPTRFLPSPGYLETFRPPSGDGIRVETGYAQGTTVTPFYDPLLAKVITVADERTQAIQKLDQALQAFSVAGVKTNIPALLRVLRSERFALGDVDTGLLAETVPREHLHSEYERMNCGAN